MFLTAPAHAFELSILALSTISRSAPALFVKALLQSPRKLRLLIPVERSFSKLLFFSLYERVRISAMSRPALLILVILLFQSTPGQDAAVHDQIRKAYAERNYLAASASIRDLEANSPAVFEANNYDYLL